MSGAPTAEVTFYANLQPAPACYPPDINGLLTMIAHGGLTGTIPSNSGGGIYVGSIPPSSSLTNKVWYKTDSAGRPLGVFMYYNGNWRKVYANVGYGEIRMYYGSGNNFDSTGLGIVGGDTDGWAICNGNNGTPTMTDGRFPMGGSWNGGAWVAPDGSQGGGENGHHITPYDLPPLQVILGAAAGRWASGSAGSWLTLPPFAAGGIETEYGVKVVDPNQIPTGGSPGAAAALPLPQYLVFGFIMFVGYA